MAFRFLVCDLDNTLYPANAGVMQAMGHLITCYLVEQMGIPPQEAGRLRQQYYQRYGTTLRGLILNHAIDREDFLAFVHALPLAPHVRPNPALDAMLPAIPLRKAVFTNASREHARRVLGLLGVGHHFEQIVDVRDFAFKSKPHPGSYLRLLEIVDARPTECILVEDSVRNLAPARAMGMTGVLVGNGSLSAHPVQQEADIHVQDILHLADAIRPLLAHRQREGAPT